jgi:uncharacterized surface protein with fasciclin (FAS1) repeats
MKLSTVLFVLPFLGSTAGALLRKNGPKRFRSRLIVPSSKISSSTVASKSDVGNSEPFDNFEGFVNLLSDTDMSILHTPTASPADGGGITATGPPAANVAPTLSPVESTSVPMTAAPTNSPVAGSPTSATIIPATDSPTGSTTTPVDSAPSSSPVEGIPMDPPTDSGMVSIEGLVSSRESLAILETALIQSNLLSVLEDPGPYTLLAPTTAAFSAIDMNVLELLLTPEFNFQLKDILLYHVIGETFLRSDLVDDEELATLSDGTLGVVVNNGEVFFMSEAASDKAVADATSSTVISPSKVVTADLLARNGVVHEIDTVFLPSWAYLNLLQQLEQDEDFSTLVEFLSLAKLSESISLTRSFTFFAPTNDAFELLSKDQLDFLRDPANLLSLQNILWFHLSPQVYNHEVTVGTVQLPTAQGTPLQAVSDGISLPTFQTDAGVEEILLNLAGNIYAVNRVLLPISRQ